MMALILRGSCVAETIVKTLQARVSALRERGIVPTLALLRVGENGSDLAYERGLVRRCREVGIALRSTMLPWDCATDELCTQIGRVNADDTVHGCLLLRPLPKHIDEAAVCASLRPRKDVDGMTPAALSGDGGYPPCAAHSCMEILDYYGIALSGKNAAVIGRGSVLGKPVARLLQERGARVTVCHSQTPNTAEICAEADILVAAAGHAGLVTAEHTNPSQVIIDAGINTRADGTLCGDADFRAVEPLVQAITPVPDGVGAVTTAVLCAHVVDAAERQNERAV